MLFWLEKETQVSEAGEKKAKCGREEGKGRGWGNAGWASFPADPSHSTTPGVLKGQQLRQDARSAS